MRIYTVTKQCGSEKADEKHERSHRKGKVWPYL